MPDQHPDEAVADLCEQAKDLCHMHDHVTRVIANLDIPDSFTDYDNLADADFDIEAMVKTFLYQEVPRAIPE